MLPTALLADEMFRNRSLLLTAAFLGFRRCTIEASLQLREIGYRDMARNSVGTPMVRNWRLCRHTALHGRGSRRSHIMMARLPVRAALVRFFAVSHVAARGSARLARRR